jgi:hypothetical protein
MHSAQRTRPTQKKSLVARTAVAWCGAVRTGPPLHPTADFPQGNSRILCVLWDGKIVVACIVCSLELLNKGPPDSHTVTLDLRQSNYRDVTIAGNRAAINILFLLQAPIFLYSRIVVVVVDNVDGQYVLWFVLSPYASVWGHYRGNIH